MWIFLRIDGIVDYPPWTSRFDECVIGDDWVANIGEFVTYESIMFCP
jgi:hypothetical protein